MSKLNRFNGWVAVLAFSCVVLGTLVQDFPMSVRGSKENYIIACSCIAIFLGFVAINMYMFFENHIGTLLESIKATIVFALWCAGIAIIQNPKNALAIVEFPEIKQVVIRNTNLYFFSWASFIASVYVLTSIAQDHDVVNVRAVPMKLIRWYLLVICSIVVLGISSRLKSLTCSSDFGLDENRCRRTDYAISFGVITAVFSIIPIVLAHLGWLKAFIEIPIAVIVTAFYCVGVAVITDTVHGPGSNIGNLYFASWIGFFLAVTLAFTSMKESLATEDEDSSPESESNLSKSERGGKGDAENVAPVHQGGGEQVHQGDRPDIGEA